MKKTIIILLFICFLFFTNSIKSDNYNSCCKDLPENHWAFEVVNFCCEKGFMEIYDGATFRGGWTATNYLFNVTLVRTISKIEDEIKSSEKEKCIILDFASIPSIVMDSYTYLKFLIYRKVFLPEFEPGNDYEYPNFYCEFESKIKKPVSKFEASFLIAKVMVWFKHLNKCLNKEEDKWTWSNEIPESIFTGTGPPFKDIPENHWVVKSINYLAEQGIIKGNDKGKFEGDKSLTRYELAMMLYRFYQWYEKNFPVMNK